VIRENVTTTLVATALSILSMAACAQSEDKALWDTEDQNIVKRSLNNICHDKYDASFKKTLHFRAYATMQDCLDSGGEEAKK
jgi:hypothetical protein